MSIYNDIKNKLDELYSRIRPDNFDEWYDDVKNVVTMFTNLSYLEYYLKILDTIKKSYEVNLKRVQGDEKEKILIKIGKISYVLNLLEIKKPDYLIERLRKEGERLAQDKDIRDAFSNQIYRILEQARLGKKDIVLYMIVRILSAFGKEVPEEIIEAIKLQYDTQLFRSFIYSFLSAFIEEEGKENESESKEGEENE